MSKVTIDRFCLVRVRDYFQFLLDANPPSNEEQETIMRRTKKAVRDLLDSQSIPSERRSMEIIKT